MWGAQAMLTTQQWLQQLKWETDLDKLSRLDRDIGISWTEVAISMALFRGMWLPVKRVTATGEPVIIQPANLAETRNLGINLAEQTASAHALVTQYKALVPNLVLPDSCKFGKCASLYVQGYHQWSTGVSQRPNFPRQQEVTALLSNYISLDTSQQTGNVTGSSI